MAPQNMTDVGNEAKLESPKSQSDTDFYALCGTETRVVRDTGKTIIRVDQDGVMYLTYHPGAVEDLDEAMAYLPDLRNHFQSRGNRPFPILIDMTYAKNINADARKFHIEPQTTELISRFAFIEKSPVARALITIFTKIERPNIVMKTFADCREARAWLVSES